MEESVEWADTDAEGLQPTSNDHMKFYKRTRPTKDSRELSSPKKTGETFPKAKEQLHSPKKTESQAQEATLNRKRVPITQTKTQSASPGKSAHVGQQGISTLQRTENQQGLQQRLKDSSSRESLGHGKKNGKEGNFEIRKYPQGWEMEGRRERTRSLHEKESFKRRAIGGSHHHRTLPNTLRESEKATGKDSGHRDVDAKGKHTENRTMSKETIDKRESLLFYKDMRSRKGSVNLPREAKGREDAFFNSKEDSLKDNPVASINSIPGALQTLKGPINPGPWKVPSSAKILSEAEVLRDPL